MEGVEKNRQMKKLKATNLMRAVVGLLFVSQLSIELAADVISFWGSARGTIILKSDGTVQHCGARVRIIASWLVVGDFWPRDLIACQLRLSTRTGDALEVVGGRVQTPAGWTTRTTHHLW